jgi:hypothetical protein
VLFSVILTFITEFSALKFLLLTVSFFIDGYWWSGVIVNMFHCNFVIFCLSARLLVGMPNCIILVWHTLKFDLCNWLHIYYTESFFCHLFKHESCGAEDSDKRNTLCKNIVKMIVFGSIVVIFLQNKLF